MHKHKRETVILVRPNGDGAALPLAAVTDSKQCLAVTMEIMVFHTNKKKTEILSSLRY
jgi:hypothetical protein